ncbi:cytochrome c oxidase accessory protein CcoG [Rhodoligotrophos appendicifer]|uniref:cytochrome c oxidase accessory protein CcoG n=1 Tax=Rhodoligotrophos appendicifer TaxID=987056 RepID=UPI0011849C87|nr:cytochrome c oxidase accessory protein CcoG [Rhodoligotrophos appendicifer]
MKDYRPPDPPVETIDVEAVNSRKRQSLYAPRIKIFPKRAAGFYRQLKWWIMAVTLGIYWITPWIRWDRGAYAPDQAVLVDLANRRFYFFFIEIWPQEFYYVAGLLIMAGLGLFLVTSVLGRAWCGYTCPQTVWTDLFIAVERMIEGDRNARMKLDKAPWTFEKLRKRVSVNVLWLLIGLCTGGAWIFYFADAPSLARGLVTFEAPAIAYTTMAILTATTFVFAGYMREQVCTYMCPWPRIQGAMLDESSLIVTYNGWRGEPRSRHQKRAEAQGLPVGDCVDCNACVAVCPMGIDIRDGEQLECITCALCIDACNDVMAKVDKPLGLISYTTLDDYQRSTQQAERLGRVEATKLQQPFTWRKIFRPRTILYSALWMAVGIAMMVSLTMRDRLGLNILPDRNPLFVTLADGSIRNGYTIKILNMQTVPQRFEIALVDLQGGSLWQAGEEDVGRSHLEVEAGADQVKEMRIFVRQARDAVRPGVQNFALTARNLSTGEVSTETTEFHAPDPGAGK